MKKIARECYLPEGLKIRTAFHIASEEEFKESYPHGLSAEDVQHVKNRSANVPATISNVVRSDLTVRVLGGDAYLVTHDDGTMAYYSTTELSISEQHEMVNTREEETPGLRG